MRYSINTDDLVAGNPGCFNYFVDKLEFPLELQNNTDVSVTVLLRPLTPSFCEAYCHVIVQSLKAYHTFIIRCDTNPMPKPRQYAVGTEPYILGVRGNLMVPPRSD